MQISKLFSFIVVASLVAVVFAGLVSVPAAGQTSTTPLAAKTTVATVNASASCIKHVIFRDDDIAPWADLNALKTVNQVFMDENVSTTLAIVPHPDTDSSYDHQNELLMDTPMLNYLLSIKTNALFEFAQHGYTHTTNTIDGNGSEYSGRPYFDQYKSIKHGWDDIAEALGVATTTFVPSWNDGDSNTVLAAHAVGHTLYSSAWYDPAMTANVPGIYLQGADFAIPWEDVNWDSDMPGIISQIDAALNAASCGADVVIVTNFWSYTQDTTSNTPIDWNKIAWLETLIEHLKARGDVDFTTLDNPHALSESARTHVTLAASNTTPAVGQSVTFTGTLSQWNPTQNKWVALTGQSVDIWHATTYYRTNDTSVTTDSNGNFSFTKSWSTISKLNYSAYFDGDDSYIRSLSFPVNITVGSASTTLTAASDNSNPAVNQLFNVSGTLKAGTTPIAGATIQLQKNISGTWTNVAGKTNNTKSDGTYNITTSEPTAASYQYRTTYAGNATYVSATSNVVYFTWHPGKWGTWASLSGQLTASPAAVAWGDGRIDVFARGTDGAVWWRNTSDGGTSWSDWTSLSGQLAATTGPAVSSMASGQLDLFVIGTDNQLWHRNYTNNVWGVWEPLSGQLTASPAAVSWADGRIDIFGRGSDGALWHKWYDSGGWRAWESLGGQLAATTGPALSSQATGKLDVFAIGSDNALWHRSYNNSAWSAWESLSGQLTASPGAVSWGDGRIDVFGRGSDNALWWRHYNNSVWSAWESLSGQLAITTGPAVSSQHEGQLDVFVVGTDHALWQRSYNAA